MQFIELGGRRYPIQFGVSMMTMLGDKYKLPKIVQAEQLISAIEWKDLDWITHSGIQNAINVLGSGDVPEKEEIADLVARDLGVMAKVIEVLTRQMTPESYEAENGEEKKATTEPTYKK